MTQIKQEIAADKGWKVGPYFPCKLAIICGMVGNENDNPNKGTDRANDLVDFCLFIKFYLCVLK